MACRDLLSQVDCVQENPVLLSRYFGDLRMYRGADKSLARPGRKQATSTDDFDVHRSYSLS